MNKEGLILNWRHLCWLLPRIRGMYRDRGGILYWIVLESDRDGGTLQLLPFPCCTAVYRSAGWLNIGPETKQPYWTIFSVRVEWDYKNRGLGTALVRAAIKYARRRGVSQLRGEVIQRDFRQSPFLLAWYTKLGFTVHLAQPIQGAKKASRDLHGFDWGLNRVATIQMDLMAEPFQRSEMS